MKILKIVEFNEYVYHERYISRTDKLNLYAGLRVHGIIFSAYILRTVNVTHELHRVKTYYQTK